MAARKGQPTAEATRTIVRDPEQRVGDHLRIFQRTDGPWIVFDERRPFGDNVVPGPDGKPLLWKTMEAAIRAAKKMAEDEMSQEAKS